MELWRTVEGNIISILVSGGAITNNLEAAKFIKRYDVGTISPLLDLKQIVYCIQRLKEVVAKKYNIKYKTDSLYHEVTTHKQMLKGARK